MVKKLVMNSMGIHKKTILQAKKSVIHGLGCFAVQFIPKGQRIVEYSGPRLNLEQTLKALEKGNEYIFDIDSHYSVDGSVMSNAGRYLNHSCDPNCESDIISGKVWIDAMRDIHKGEEVTINYNYELEGFSNRSCQCGSKNCPGFMIANHQLGLKNPQKLLRTMMEMSNEIISQKKQKRPAAKQIID